MEINKNSSNSRFTFGRFYLQGVKAYTKDSPMITSREASIFALECFLLMGCDGVLIESLVKEEAESAALAWRKRLVAEGGLNRASEPDSRGLLLLISCFRNNTTTTVKNPLTTENSRTE